MRCETCHGTGLQLGLDVSEPPICGICLGSGIAYCCDEAGVNPPNVYKPLETAVFESP